MYCQVYISYYGVYPCFMRLNILVAFVIKIYIVYVGWVK